MRDKVRFLSRPEVRERPMTDLQMANKNGAAGERGEGRDREGQGGGLPSLHILCHQRHPKMDVDSILLDPTDAQISSESPPP